MNTLTAMVLTLLFWTWLAAVFCGIGMLVRRLFAVRVRDALGFLQSVWVGWSVCLLFLQLWHLVLPVGGAALGIVCAAGLAGLAWNMSDLWALARHEWKRTAVWSAAWPVLALWTANHSVMQPGIYDSGFYHLAAVRWISSYPITPGLANLSPMLGFNNASFLYAAMLDVGPFAHRSHHLASGFLILLAMVHCLRGVEDLWRGGDRLSARSAFDALFLVPLCVWAVDSGYMSTASPDVGVFVIGLVVGSELMSLLDPAAREQPRESICRFSVILLLAAAGVTVKLSFVAIGATASALALMRVPQVRAPGKGVVGVVFRASVLPALLIVPWIARFVILSGYLVYPSTFCPFPVDWRVPVESAENHAAIIRAWARMPDVPPDTVLGNWSWVWPWMNRVAADHGFGVVLPVGLTCLCLFVLLLRRERRTDGQARLGRFLLVPAAGLAFCFLTAPDPRFAGAAFWLLAAGALTCLLVSLERTTALWMIGTFSVAVFFQNVDPIAFLRTWKDPGPARTVPMKTMVTQSGLQVLVPEEGDQSWDAPLPSTPYFKPNLRLRVEGDLSGGFTRNSRAAGNDPG